MHNNQPLPADYSHLGHWSTADGINLQDADMMYCPSNFHSSRSSISCDAEHVVDHDERPPYQSYLSRSSTVGSPQGTPQYQLPSPEEDVILDPAFIDKERRREQNRVAQRAFRERKETKLRQLEKQINKLKTDQNKLERKYHNLRTAHLRLQSGLKILLDASGTFDDFDPEADGYDVDTKS